MHSEVRVNAPSIYSLILCKAAKADNAVGEQFEASLASGVMASNPSYQKAKNASAGNNKIKELKAELAIIMAEAKTSSSGVVRVNQKSKSKSLGTHPCLWTMDEMVLDGVEIVSLEAFYPTIFTKAGASKTHEDAPMRKSKKTKAAVAPDPSSSGKRRRNVKSESGFQRPADWASLSVDSSGETGNIFGGNTVWILEAFSNKLDKHGLAVESARSHWVKLTERCGKAWEALLNGFPGLQAVLVSCRIGSMQGCQSGGHSAEHIVSHIPKYCAEGSISPVTTMEIWSEITWARHAGKSIMFLAPVMEGGSINRKLGLNIEFDYINLDLGIGWARNVSILEGACEGLKSCDSLKH
ncbi:hypothetical protein DFH08DRAFT_806262 [Mycena albidolilacea]|uniref:Uncharacterized protein n=1 Tax=Mycena albidolilacea TaxID=1033008 RepID=A0AAD7A7V6_9AGAR|nr:hypothetical protein DFH08DRAFT_806262 [Mycena albidolilacea]